MKRIFTLLLATVLLTQIGQAQLADGSQAPNYMATDLDGVEHVVQTYLDSGKIVIIDVFATWCPPCWVLHENHVLQDLYTQYGPDGTDELVILSVEGDDDTDMADLMGTGANTQGNWLEGIDYPVIDDISAPGTFNLAFWPSIYMIRPSGQTMLVNDYMFLNIIDPSRDWVYELAKRPDVDATLRSNFSDVVFCGEYGRSASSITLQNTGTTTITSAEIMVMYDGEVQETINWSGNLTEFSTAFVSVPAIPVQTEPVVISYEIGMVNGGADNYQIENVTGYNVDAAPIATQTVEFSITTDFWPEEISWQLRDDNNNLVASNADVGALSCDQTYMQSFQLPSNGCYTLSVNDSYGDGILNGAINPGSHNCTTENGMASNAMGAISVTVDGTVIYDDIAYGSGTNVEFEYAGTVSVESIKDLTEAKLYPNPTSDHLNLEFGLETSSDIRIQVIDQLGRVVHDFGVQRFLDGDNKVNIETLDFANGIYYIRMNRENEISTFKFTVAH